MNTLRELWDEHQRRWRSQIQQILDACKQNRVLYVGWREKTAELTVSTTKREEPGVVWRLAGPNNLSGVIDRLVSGWRHHGGALRRNSHPSGTDPKQVQQRAKIVEDGGRFRVTVALWESGLQKNDPQSATFDSMPECISFAAAKIEETGLQKFAA
jgi:hypothetical protein